MNDPAKLTIKKRVLQRRVATVMPHVTNRRQRTSTQLVLYAPQKSAKHRVDAQKKYQKRAHACRRVRSLEAILLATLVAMTIDDLVNQLRDAVASQSGAGADLQKNLRATLSAGLAKLDVVTRQEFEIQREMLDALRKQVDELTAQVSAYDEKSSKNR
jgi:ubiquinone biosynthesis accessory factor UbiK